MGERMYYLFNGKVCKEDEKVEYAPLTAGVMYGFGVFETIKVKNHTPLYLKEHLQRLRSAIEYFSIGFTYSDEQIVGFVKTVIKKNKCNGAIKISVIKNKTVSDLIIMMRKSNYYYKHYQKGVSLKISSVIRNSTSNIVRFKTTNYLENYLELKKAKKENFDEVLFVNEKGYLAEGAISNLFFIKADKIYTPSLENGLLNGIMRQRVLTICREQNIEVIEGDFRLDELKESDEIFITNSLMEVMPVRRIHSLDYQKSDFKFSEKLRNSI